MPAQELESRRLIIRILPSIVELLRVGLEIEKLDPDSEPKIPEVDTVYPGWPRPKLHFTLPWSTQSH
jgi:hypothetical protein